MTADLLCLGEPMLELNRQPADADGRVRYLEGFGGDASTVAIAAARSGARAGMIAALGADAAGDAFIALYEREGVETTSVQRSAAHPTGLYLVTHGPAGHAFHFYRSNSAAAMMRPADLPVEAIAAARMLHASGISQAISASAADSVFEAIATARRHGVQVAYDTNYRPLLWPAARAAAVMHAAIAEADIALPSLEDAVTLTGREAPDAILDFYLGLGPRIVVLKMGAAGVRLATAAGRETIAAPQVDAIDATGAGDTFCGAFLARLIAGDRPAAAARYAVVAAALATTGRGAVAPIPRAAVVQAALAQLNL